MKETQVQDPGLSAAFADHSPRARSVPERWSSGAAVASRSQRTVASRPAPQPISTHVNAYARHNLWQALAVQQRK
jgi:hypothetical protein